MRFDMVLNINLAAAFINNPSRELDKECRQPYILLVNFEPEVYLDALWML
jgi:hypothetical protein